MEWWWLAGWWEGGEGYGLKSQLSFEGVYLILSWQLVMVCVEWLADSQLIKPSVIR